MGVGAPNDSASNGKTMCAIILTKEYGFIRVYPIPAEDRFPIWSMGSFVIVKGSDPRPSSWKLETYELTGKIDCQSTKREILDRCVIKTGFDDPMNYQNANRQSIFMVKPNWGTVSVSLTQKVPKQIPTDDQDCGWIVTQGRHWLKPYIEWESDQGIAHKSHLGGREIYEGIRNNPTAPWNLMNNLQIMNPDYEFWMLMGNMKNKMNVWLCVHLHRLKKSIGGSTPLFSHPIIGENSAWPYEKQQDKNVLTVGCQPLLFTMNDMISPSYLGNMTQTN